jgi:hypothetical protein
MLRGLGMTLTAALGDVVPKISVPGFSMPPKNLTALKRREILRRRSSRWIQRAVEKEKSMRKAAAWLMMILLETVPKKLATYWKQIAIMLFFDRPNGS